MKKRGFLTALAAIFLIIFYAGAVIADDIMKNDDDIESVYTDHKAYKVGDIVTIIVVESTQGTQSASLSTQKQQSLKGGLGMGTWGSGQGAPISGVPQWGASGSEYQDGGGKSVRSGSLVAKISARVEKVLSNGNLVIKGTKIILVNDDKQNLIIKGVIRAEDIASDNTIYSTNVADAVIEYEGNGPIGEKTTPGFITRLLDWLGIF
jgi:flagellar L-ring protein FlgH